MLFLTFKLEKKKNSLKIESKDFKEKGKKGMIGFKKRKQEFQRKGRKNGQFIIPNRYIL